MKLALLTLQRSLKFRQLIFFVCYYWVGQWHSNYVLEEEVGKRLNSGEGVPFLKNRLKTKELEER